MGFIALLSHNGAFKHRKAMCLNWCFFQSWATNKWVPSQVQAAKTKFLRRVNGVTLRDEVRSCEIHKTLNVKRNHRIDPPSTNDPTKKSLGPAQSPPHWCRTFPLLLAQMEYGLIWDLWVWRRRTNRRPCCPPPTSSWTARPDGSGRWDNRMAAQHLPQNLARPSSG